MIWFALLCVLIVGISYAGYWVAFYNPVSRHGEIVHASSPAVDKLCAEMDAAPYERVCITSHDGLKLCGRYYHVADGANLHIQFHGYRGSGSRDFGAGNAVAKKAGLNTLVVDQRAHGESQGDTVTFGILERYDCQAWANYAAERFGSGCAIFLSGISMGAATVLMASELALPENVAGIIADCPYTSPGDIIRKVCRDVKLPSALMYPFVALGALIFGRFRLWASSPIQAVRNTDIPILLLHGSEDKYVPASMSGKIFEACAGLRYLEIFPGAAHCGCCLTDTPRYERVLRAFMEECISGEDAVGS